jgi:hypothetical protein
MAKKQQPKIKGRDKSPYLLDILDTENVPDIISEIIKANKIK